MGSSPCLGRNPLPLNTQAHAHSTAYRAESGWPARLSSGCWRLTRLGFGSTTENGEVDRDMDPAWA